MSAADLTVVSVVSEQPSAVRSQGKARVSWARVVFACAVLLLAGVVRYWQERRVEAVLQSGRNVGFPLKMLPMSLGPWRVPGEREEDLDPEIKQVTRTIDFVKRHYVNEQTGVGVDILILYGSVSIAHKPEICYPGAGFTLVENPRRRTLPVAGGAATFLSLIFAKGEGGAVEKQEVLYSLRVGSKWTVDLDFKRLERVPSLYKVQLSRRVGPGERLENAGPCVSFLDAMLPELENRISGRP